MTDGNKKGKAHCQAFPILNKRKELLFSENGPNCFAGWATLGDYF